MPGQHKIWERQSTWNVFNQLTTRKTNYWKLFPDKRKQNIILINFNKKTETENHNFSFQEDFKSILIDLKSPKQNVTLSIYSPQEAKKACKLIRDRFGITEASQLLFWDNGLLNLLSVSGGRMDKGRGLRWGRTAQFGGVQIQSRWKFESDMMLPC